MGESEAPPDSIVDGDLLVAAFHDEKSASPQVTEEQIQQVLERTGKSDPQQQLNCGACGYESCREKAIAVVLGWRNLKCVSLT